LALWPEGYLPGIRDVVFRPYFPMSRGEAGLFCDRIRAALAKSLVA
jgi:hypothetical protein